MQSRLDPHSLLKNAAGKNVVGGGEPKDAQSIEQQAQDKLYLNEKKEPCMPSEHLWSSMVHAATDFRIQGRRGKSYRSLIASHTNITPKLAPIIPPHWEVELKAGNNRLSGRIPVSRPLFPGGWTVKMQIHVRTDQLTDETVKKILEHAGDNVGLGSYRPTNNGPYGRFMVREFNGA